ncbi:type I DNA topoisomerase [Blastococcus sp. MG754426]|uniref:type I DNA topoisomerase n=1 Tax=unclassified Blastococcus TaxID=2619396 RepID=UPI001EF10044|nr:MULTISPECIES: type I DNA topoisomerase [unclassified Blastococcus]MCF6506241.1 type I DNA topoisomerase [Blastococcus sp. MG754426]MCF6510381.1 type I DNA topoisomerase [Blastococcus sp. MG754427]
MPTKTTQPGTENEPTTGGAAKTPARRGSAAPGGRPLVIVESPTKASKIAGYLGSGYVVEASVGHIRDLPRNAADVPAEHKGAAWARLGVDVDNSFEPLYVVSPDRKQQVTRLKQLVKNASEIYLATDEDREGEAIAWHLIDTLKPRVPVRRMVFHEITPEAIARAVANPRDLDTHLVDAQETRRILDRLYGYEVSPVLWKKVLPKLSAGRVQSVATRIVVERERERMAFHAADYWSLEGTFAVTGGRAGADAGEPTTVRAKLVSVDDSRVATGRDFDPATGRVTGDVVHLDEAGARGLAARLEGRQVSVSRVDEKPYRRRPYAPFTTSTLQMEAGRKLGWSSAQTMRVAQRLYENGHITYMRTDSTNLSQEAIDAARQQARELYGDAYVPAEARRYAKKSKGAQEAHEAIRPAGDSFRTPGQLAAGLARDEFRLYELIWQRTVASQMADAVGQTVSVRLAGRSATDEAVEFTASGRTITFPGFLRAYVESRDEGAQKDGEDDHGSDDAERRLPRLERGQQLDTEALDAKGHTTQPPSRYTEPSLVARLEELGIGRPSTFASIMQTIQDRGYVWKKGNALVPSFIAFAVTNLLEQHFAQLVDYDFTASLETELDEIAGGTLGRVDWLTEFYFGGEGRHAGAIAQSGGLKQVIGQRLEEIDARGVNSIPLRATDPEGRPVVVRVGRYGPYLQAGGEDGARVSIPEDLAPDELTTEKVRELLEAPSGDRELGTDPESGHPVVVKAGRYGPYVTTVVPEGSKESPRTASLFSSMSPETVTIEDALKLLTLPRTVGTAPDGEEIQALNGRYGPYLKKGTDSRSLDGEEKLFTTTLDEALAIFAQPKQRGRAAAKAPLKELGPDPVTQGVVTVREGRFGPYVTDGETNASLRKGDDVESITIERAAELLADRRARGPATKKKAAKKTTAKKTAAKKTTAKKTTAKKAASADAVTAG